MRSKAFLLWVIAIIAVGGAYAAGHHFGYVDGQFDMRFSGARTFIYPLPPNCVPVGKDIE